MNPREPEPQRPQGSRSRELSNIKAPVEARPESPTTPEAPECRIPGFQISCAPKVTEPEISGPQRPKYPERKILIAQEVPEPKATQSQESKSHRAPDPEIPGSLEFQESQKPMSTRDL
ncbi:cornifin alpha-like [Tachyglossus aculeatus]|uniref:cornifin alpha-like n=1 Tax=Tachyglossus aculeatus TaxID=9261 RepID=UPI0018F4A56C|nr:cornifin alpha-like [Tachyglossus aculeatus]